MSTIKERRHTQMSMTSRKRGNERIIQSFFFADQSFIRKNNDIGLSIPVVPEDQSLQGLFLELESYGQIASLSYYRRGGRIYTHFSFVVLRLFST